VSVPPGTVAFTDPDGAWIGEVLQPGERLVIARGGRGGRGNVHFVSPTHQAPQHAEKGDPGDEGWIRLELKIIADIGLVGAPNAGKSTLLAALTDARPDVAAYPFTTLSPNLGSLALGEGDEPAILVADVPGLIEGAHEGHGLGHEFLRHVERTRALIGVVDGTADDPAADWRAVLAELTLHDPALADRPRRLVVSKQDEPAAATAWPRVRRALERAGEHPIAVSAHDGSGLDTLRAEIGALLTEATAVEAARAADAPRAIHRFDPDRDGWEVIAEGDGLRVRGRAIETAAARIDFENEESRERFQRRLERLGIDAALRSHGARPGMAVHIGPLELAWGDEE
jgi:GTP-binding protein